ncbi:MAG: hypothetical protein QGH33_11870 [Pirellulaceae bacterium]|nr:hypothetical protein [Pirellulaceae bacterium]MDP7303195.1 hypothetical protein [Pirellulaceae bacterium]HJN10806.1 hypothetical protein [Pirellulaceae bacterium]
MKKLSGKPFALLGINSDKDLETLRETVIEERITWRSWWDEGQIDGPIQTTWQVLQRPTIHLLDAKGVIRYKNVQPEGLDTAIDELLAETQGKRD